MQVDNAFDVKAPPDRVYGFLLDANKLIACVPGAELVEQIDPQTFKGKVKVKVGPVTVAYVGLARIADRDEANRTATVEAEGRETTAPGSARSRSTMAVVGSNGGSTVRISTEFTVSGRAATFGRGLMEDVSKRMVAQVADRIRDELEGGPGAMDFREPREAKPVNAIGLLFSIVWERIRSWFGT